MIVRTLVVMGTVVALAGASACNRAHMYKTAGIATRRAFAAQVAPHGGPAPRGLDGDEASLLISAQKRTAAGEEGGAGGPGGPAKPAALMLQSK